jgi:drug/metabolite transporter (DMT)-like permease
MTEPPRRLPISAASPHAGPPLLGAYLLAGLATFLWASNVVAVKLLLRDIPAFPAGLLRITLAGGALLSWHLLLGRPLLPPRSDRAVLLQLGIGGIAWSFLFFTLALHYTSIGHAVFIGALTPMTVLLLARLEGQERITFIKLAGLLVSLLGILLLALDHTDASAATWWGDALAMAGLLCFSFFTVRSKRLAARYDPVSLNAYAFGIAALFCLPFLGAHFSDVPWPAITWTGWLSLLYSATAGSAGAYLAYYAALRLLTASQVSAFQYVQPVLSTFFGAVFLHELWGARFAAGAALILAGVFLAERR